MSESAVLAIEATNIELQQGADHLKQILDSWISDNMKSVRRIADSDDDRQTIDFSDIGNIKSPDIDISQSLGIGLASSLIMFIVNPSFAVATFFLAAFGSWFLSAESRRAEQINNIMNQANYNSKKFLETCNNQYEVAIDAYSKKMAEYVNAQLKSHLNDLKRQIEDLGKPLSDKEQVDYQNAFKEFKRFRDEIEDLKDEVQVYYHQA